MAKMKYKQLIIVNSSLLGWLKRQIQLPEDVRVVKVLPGIMRDDESRIILESKEFPDVLRPIESIPIMIPTAVKK